VGLKELKAMVGIISLEEYRKMLRRLENLKDQAFFERMNQNGEESVLDLDSAKKHYAGLDKAQ
jgi:hypothetical protein